MNTIKSSLLVLACLALTSAYTQEIPQLTSKDSIVQSSWIFGLGYNIVDDSGNAFGTFPNSENQLNVLAYPSRISIGRYFKNGIGLEAIGTYNKYKEGKLIDGVINPETSNYFGVDARITYDLNKVIGETRWFDPYLGVGVGYTDANNTPRGTYNTVVGFRTWFSDRLGLDLNASGKWSIGNEATNHIQYGAGVVYQFGIEKGLSKKGIKKIAMIQALEKEKQRVTDSIAAVDRAKQEADLAERLTREKETARLAAIEKAKIDAENTRKQQIENAIKELGFVYFDLNSSYLTKKSKEILEALALILNNNPQVELKITSYTDSRGKSQYNNWLSKRRVDRTVEYLTKKEIDANRLTSEGYGEENLLNECDDTNYCLEEKHQINRRSEFEIVKYK